MAEIRVPSLGHSVTEVTVGAWRKRIGDTFAADDELVEIQTDKVAVDVRSELAGILVEVIAPEGSRVAVGGLLAIVEHMSSQTSAPTFVRVPPLFGASAEATVKRWLMQPGQAVKSDDPIAEIETEYAVLEICTTSDGMLQQILAQPGATVRVGDALARIQPAPGSTELSAPKPQSAFGSVSSHGARDINRE